jgi:hypothetical protein
MRRWLIGLAVCCAAIIAISAAPQSAYAEYPPYIFLQPNYSGYGYAPPTPAYSYGWFGVSLRRHFTNSWDYYDHRWLWW